MALRGRNFAVASPCFVSVCAMSRTTEHGSFYTRTTYDFERNEHIPPFLRNIRSLEGGADRALLETQPVVLDELVRGGGHGAAGLIEQAFADLSSQVEHLESFESLSFETDGRSPSLNLTTIKFDSEEFAIGHMEILLSEAPGMQSLPEPIGDSAFYIEVNQSGIGSMVVFKSGVWIVMLHTAQGANDAPLMDLAGVESLARIIADRL